MQVFATNETTKNKHNKLNATESERDCIDVVSVLFGLIFAFFFYF